MPEGSLAAGMLIEIAYAGSDAQTVVVVRLDPPATVDDALRLVATDRRFAGSELETATVGIYGVVVAREQALADGDRIEIYRVLNIDPKLARRRRANPKTLSKSVRS